jgi:hypothetical protein
VRDDNKPCNCNSKAKEEVLLTARFGLKFESSNEFGLEGFWILARDIFSEGNGFKLLGFWFCKFEENWLMLEGWTKEGFE